MALRFGVEVIGEQEEKVLPICLDLVKSYLRIGHSQQDTFLKNLIHIAKGVLEESTGQSLLKRTLKIKNTNNHVFLPYGPVRKIKKVLWNGKDLEAGEGYCLKTLGHSFELHVVEKKFTRQSRHANLEVIYEAGYGEKAQDVPYTFRENILRKVNMLYQGALEEEGIEKHSLSGAKKDMYLSSCQIC